MNGPLHIQSFLWAGWMKPIWLCLIDSAGWKSSADNELWIEGELWANATGAGGGNDCINIYSRRKRLQGSGNQYKLIWNEPLDCDFYSDAGENTIDCISETGEVNCNFFLCAPKWSFFERSMNVGKVKFPAKHCARVWYNEMINQILYDLIKLDRWPQKGLL